MKILIIMIVTAYCPCEKCCGQFADGVTASNYVIQTGDVFCAADKIFPFGTEFIISGYNKDQPVKVLDRGGAIKGNKLDVYFSSHIEALAWGKRVMIVELVRIGDRE
jgi:3D (Asp-Asp-Asp) domain-containing protein